MSDSYSRSQQRQRGQYSSDPSDITQDPNQQLGQGQGQWDQSGQGQYGQSGQGQYGQSGQGQYGQSGQGQYGQSGQGQFGQSGQQQQQGWDDDTTGSRQGLGFSDPSGTGDVSRLLY